MRNTNDSDLQRLHAMVDGWQVSQVIMVAARLGIPDRLVDGPKYSEELARATGAEPESFFRLLRVLVSIEILRQEADGRFALAPLGQSLRSDAPNSLHAYAVHRGQPYNWAAWGDLLHSVVTGESAFQHVHGVSAWEYRQRHLEAGRLFDADIASTADTVIDSIMRAYRFDDARRIVDVGGGRGVLLAAVLVANLAAHGVLLDQPSVVAEAEPVLRAAGVADRCEMVAGDFFEAVPAGGDLYILKGIIHDWDDEAARRILARCREAIAPGGRLLLVEIVLPDEVSPRSGSMYFMDLQMLVMHGAHERGRADHAALLDAAGFRLARIVPTSTMLSLIEAVPAEG